MPEVPTLPGLPPVPPPPSYPPIPPSLPPVPPNGTIEVLGQAVAVEGDEPAAQPHSDVTPPGERPRRTRRTREQMEAARATAVSTTSAPPTPEQPVPTAAPDASPGFGEAPSQVPTGLPNRADMQHPRISPIDPNAKPKFWTSVGATINLGNYESMKLDMGVSGIDYDASSEEIERIMSQAEVGIHETIEGLMNKIIDKARDIKIARGLPVSGDE